MKVRTFKAKSYSEALKLVKESLGGDAVILSNRLVPPEPGEADSRPSVELAAAVGDGATDLLHQASNLKHRPHRLEPAYQRRNNWPEVLKPFRRRLLEEEVRERLVDQVMDAVANRMLQLGPRGSTRALDFVITELMERIPVLGDDRRRSGLPRMTSLVGASGVGKSTLLAKLAVAAALQERHRVAIVSCGRKGHARESMRMTAGVLECPLHEADSPQVLKRILDDLTGFDQIFLDAPGVSPFDEMGVARLKAMLDVAPGAEVHLVLNASSRDVDLLKALEVFGALSLKGLAFARLDEASCFGGVLNAVDSSRLPLTWFGFGREIPADLERATRERVLDLLLDLSSKAHNGVGSH